MEKAGTRAILMGSAPETDWSFLKDYYRAGDALYCVDGGLVAARQLGLTPDWYVGDSDSGGDPQGLPAEVLPPEKDLTDMEMALDLARRQGMAEVILCGCLGGRQDHHLANLMLLQRAEGRGMRGRIVDSRNEIRWLNPGMTRVEPALPFHYFGIVPLDAMLEQVTIRGAKYEITDTDIPRGSTLGVSNEFLPGVIPEIRIARGEGLLILSQRLNK